MTVPHERHLRVVHHETPNGLPHIDISFNFEQGEGAVQILMVLDVHNIPEDELVAGTLRDIADSISPISETVVVRSDSGEVGRLETTPRPRGFNPRPAGFNPEEISR